MLQHLLREESIRIGLEAPDRRHALEQMLQLIPGNALNPSERERLLEMLLQRENFGTTAIGDGIAMPHCSFSSVSFPLAAFGISRHGIEYASLDGEPVHFVFLAVFPEVGDIVAHKRQILFPVESILRDRFLQGRLFSCDEPHDAYEILMREVQTGLSLLRAAQ